MSGHQLPTELWELVMTHLTVPGDAETLKAAALVCHAWELPSRRQLFSTLTVDGAKLCARLISLFRASPHLPLFVQALVLLERWDDSAKFYDSWLHDQVHLPALLAQCKFIKSLKLGDTALGDQLCLNPALPMLERLVLGQNLWMASDKGLPNFLLQNTPIRDVEIIESDIAPILEALVKGTVRLQTLKICRPIVGATTSIDRFSGALDVVNIEMTIQRLADIAVFNSLLLGASSSVRRAHCHLEMTSLSTRKFDLQSIPTAYAPQLAHLEISVCHAGLTQQFPVVVSWIRTILARMEAPALEKITLHFEAHGATCPPSSIWTGLDSALEKFQARHSAFQWLLVDIAADRDFAFETSKTFPRLDEKGLLQVQRRE